MQITLNQSEIEKAIIAFVGNQGICITGKTTVTLVAGRAPNGMSATIDISNEDSKTTVVDITETVVETKTELNFKTKSAPAEPVLTAEEAKEDQETKPLFGKC